MSPLHADLHNHTYYSPDSILSPDHLLRRARQRKLSVVAVTDHNTIRGGLATRDLAARNYPDIRIIVGEEVRTREGEVLGLFLSEDVPRGLSAAETIDRIHAQGGLAGAPHPYDTFRSGLNETVLHELAPQLDFIEGLNSRMIFAVHNEKARQFAPGRGLPLSAASDAHSPREIGRAYVTMPDFETPAQFLESLHAGKLKGRLSSPFIHMVSRYATIRTRLGWRPPD
jgi:predicted metal-dependent phosphoesterase TrpH